MIVRFRYLQVGLGLVLVFVGVKMAGSERSSIPIFVSLIVVAGLIGGSIAASLWSSKRSPARGDTQHR